MMSSASQTVLLVEDNANDVILLQRTLRRAHVAGPVHVVSNGEEAMAYLRGDPPFEDREAHPLPALIFLDLKLPGLSGFELLAWIRQQPRLKRIPVVVLTVSSNTLDIYRAYELGANSYLVKPVSLVAFEAMVKSLNLQWLLEPVPAQAVSAHNPPSF